MLLSDNQRFELKARAFEILFGMLAPGKDDRSGRSPELRSQVWMAWHDAHRRTIDAMLTSFQENLEI